MGACVCLVLSLHCITSHLMYYASGRRAIVKCLVLGKDYARDVGIFSPNSMCGCHNLSFSQERNDKYFLFLVKGEKPLYPKLT